MINLLICEDQYICPPACVAKLNKINVTIESQSLEVWVDYLGNTKAVGLDCDCGLMFRARGCNAQALGLNPVKSHL